MILDGDFSFLVLYLEEWPGPWVKVRASASGSLALLSDHLIPLGNSGPFLTSFLKES